MPLVPLKLIQKQLDVSGSPTGPRSAIDRMLEFAARHQISPQIERFAMSRVNDAMEQAIGDAPLLSAAHQGDGFVIQPQYPTATLLMVAIQETNHITDGDFVTPKSVPGLFTYFDIRPLKVDGSIRNQPDVLCGGRQLLSRA